MRASCLTPAASTRAPSIVPLHAAKSQSWSLLSSCYARSPRRSLRVFGSDDQQHQQQDADEPSQQDAGKLTNAPSVTPATPGEAGSDPVDWRTFRARLVASSKGAPLDTAWAHAVPRPEKGSLLLAHPLMFASSQTYFHKAVILLLDHSPAGSYGVILNNPTTLTLGQITTDKKSLEQFSDCRIFLGGDVGHGEVVMLHGVPELEGAMEVVGGVYLGGISAASRALHEGRATSSQFRWYLNYAGWGAGQLEGECKRGVWFTAAASPSLILGEGERLGAAAGAPAGDALSPEKGDVGVDGNASLWHAVLERMGGDYRVLSETVREKERESLRTPKEDA